MGGVLQSSRPALPGSYLQLLFIFCLVYQSCHQIQALLLPSSAAIFIMSQFPPLLLSYFISHSKNHLTRVSFGSHHLLSDVQDVSSDISTQIYKRSSHPSSLLTPPQLCPCSPACPPWAGPSLLPKLRGTPFPPFTPPPNIVLLPFESPLRTDNPQH